MQNSFDTNQSGKVNLRINKITIEWYLILILLVFSFINNITLLVFLLLILLFLMQKEIGAIKVLNLITLRTIINPGFAVDISQWQNVKWIIIFICSFYLLYSYFKLDVYSRNKIKSIMKFIFLFIIYIFISSLIFSSLPTISIFKLISYAVVFLGILVGVSYTYKKYNWLRWILRMFQILMITSIPTIVISEAYLRNGYSFQGVTNHPNMFGIISVLFMAVLITYIRINKPFGLYSKIFLVLQLVASFYMVFISNSRTAFIGCVIIILFYIILSKINRAFKIFIYNNIFILCVFIFVHESSINSFLMDFLYKGQETLLYSRTAQLEGLLFNFLSNPWVGSGFAVPVLPYRTFAFSFDHIVEPGNLIIAVLSYGGIFGFILFSVYMLKIFWANIRQLRNVGLLFISPILISMGEMVFFSTNNIGIWCYMSLAMYVFTD